MPPALLRMTAVRATFAAFTAVALVGCGSSTEPSGPPAADAIPASIAAVSTDTLRGQAGAQANGAIMVTVKNAAGNPVDTATVTFAIASGGGTLSATSVRTNASGQASTTWMLGTAATTQTVTASVGTLSPVTFVAIAASGAPATITKLAGDTQTGVVGTGLPVLPSVKVSDQFGNPVSGSLVTFSAGSNGGLVNGGAVNTGANGIATVTAWRLGNTVGTYTITVSAGSGITTTFRATAVAGAPATITLTPAGPLALTAGQSVSLASRVIDSLGNVLASPVTYTSSNSGIVTVSTTGVATGIGAGTASIIATAGTATAAIAVSVTGHPLGTAISSTTTFASTLGDIAFTRSSLLVALNGQKAVAFYNGDMTAPTSPVLTLGTPVPFLIAGMKSDGPALAINQGTTSRVWYINPASGTLTDSIDIAEVVNGAAITSNGATALFMLSNGDVAVLNVAARTQSRIQLGGGTTKIKIARGDTLAYVLTNVGILFEIDVRSNSVKRQIVLPSVSITDFDVSRDGSLIYLLDGAPGVVRIFNLSTFTPVRVAQVTGNALTISLSPDDAQTWTTHAASGPNGSPLVSWSTGSIATGYISTGAVQLPSLPLRIYFSPTGSFAAVTELGGSVDIIR